MKNIFGISAFGLKDCVVQHGTSCRELGFYLADAVLPMNPFGRIRTGDEAENERTHTGLYWPREARIQQGKPLRRVPIPFAWRALVEAGDRTIRWSVGRGVSFILPRILASHVTSLIVNGPHKKGQSQNKDELNESRNAIPVLAIPDNLDEFGQENLIRELVALGYHRTTLIWRPVAAALSWLNKVEGDLPSLMGNSPRRMGMNDHIHVIYLGPDAFEFTTFRLQVREHKGFRYVLPLRDRPNDLPHLTGMDWTGKLIEDNFKDIDHGAFWQAFTSFTEIWETISGRAWNQKELPKPWSIKQKWGLWNPSPNLYDRIYNIQEGPCETLREILRASCRLDPVEVESWDSIETAFRKKLRQMAETFPGGKLRGMIICGPLVSCEIPPWLVSYMDAFSARGLDFNGKLTEPEANRLWLCSDCDDPIAEGAAIYGQKTLKGIPSYLDTMPQVSVLAQEKGRYIWVPLLNAQEVIGGEEFKAVIQGRFQLDQDQKKLHAYLYKGPLEKAQTELEDLLDTQTIPFENISPCQARIVREVVRKLGSKEAVRQRGLFKGDSNIARYGLYYSEALFSGEDGENNELIEASSDEMIKTPFRRAIFNFPTVPTRDVILDVEVRMRPASGLAKVELVSKDPSFMQGQKVRLNYATMRRVAKLPKSRRGWPRIQEIVVDPKDDILIARKNLVNIFERTSPTAENYKTVIDRIRDNILRGADQKSIAGLWLYVNTIAQDGQACTQEGNDIIGRIASKFESDFYSFDMAGLAKRQVLMFSRASWLYTSAPSNVVAYVKDILVGDFSRKEWAWATEAASRTFVQKEEFRLLFNVITNRAKRVVLGFESFPIQTARAICRILMYRKEGEKGLDSDMAQLFARRAIERLNKLQEQRKFKILYFQLIMLLLYLLRFRKSDSSCFDPDSTKTIEVFEDAMESMEKAKMFFSRRNEHYKAKRVQNIIDGFEKYLHYEGTEDVLTVLGDFAGDMV
jgi:hypothetical protein